MMNLDEGVRVAKIAKVREKLSNGEQEIDDIDEVIKNAGEDNGKTDIFYDDTEEDNRETDIYDDIAEDGDETDIDSEDTVNDDEEE